MRRQICVEKNMHEKAKINPVEDNEANVLNVAASVLEKIKTIKAQQDVLSDLITTLNVIGNEVYSIALSLLTSGRSFNKDELKKINDAVALLKEYENQIQNPELSRIVAKIEVILSRINVGEERDEGDGSLDKPYDLKIGLENSAYITARDSRCPSYFIHNGALIKVDSNKKTVSPGIDEHRSNTYVMKMVGLAATCLGYSVV